MSEHTPGPWVIDEDGRVMQSSNGANVSGLVVRRMTPADAALIAAAPDLLEALKKLVKAYTFAVGFEGRENECCLDARDAIAKAEGKP